MNSSGGSGGNRHRKLSRSVGRAPTTTISSLEWSTSSFDHPSPPNKNIVSSNLNFGYGRPPPGPFWSRSEYLPTNNWKSRSMTTAGDVFLTDNCSVGGLEGSADLQSSAALRALCSPKFRHSSVNSIPSAAAAAALSHPKNRTEGSRKNSRQKSPGPLTTTTTTTPTSTSPLPPPSSPMMKYFSVENHVNDSNNHHSPQRKFGFSNDGTDESGGQSSMIYTTFDNLPNNHQMLSLEHLSREQMDKILLQHGNGIELAFERTKAWSKYCKEILNFVQRRINLETEHAKQVQRLAEATKSTIQDDDYMPLQAVFIKSFKQELDFVKQCNETMRNLYDFKFIKPLEGRRAEHDRKRKDLKAKWDRCVKIANETQAELKKANEVYKRRDEMFVNARESSLSEESKNVKDSKAIEKKKSKEQETHQKKVAAANACKSLEHTLTKQMRDLEKTRMQILKELGDLIMQCDQTTKACTNAYFQSLSGLWAGLPIQYQEMGNLAFEYKPGFEYNQYVQSLGPAGNRLGGQCMGSGSSMAAAATGLGVGGDRNRENNETASEDDDFSGENDHQTPHRRTSCNNDRKGSFTAAARTPQPSRGNTNPDLTLDQDVEDALASYHNHHGSTQGLERFRSRTEDSGSTTTTTNEGGELLVGTTSGGSHHNQCVGTHNLVRSRVPAKCAHCDIYSFIYTSYCTECHLTWHKSCLGDMKQICSPLPSSSRSIPNSNPNASRNQRQNSFNNLSDAANRLTVFGPPLEDHLKRYDLDLPIVLTKCVHELDKRGLHIKGLYRVCGTKSKIDELCKAFERSLGDTDLSVHSPATIASCLKVYFRNLPECLLTDQLYSEWMSIVADLPKDHENYVVENAEDLKEDIRSLLNRLPTVNYDALKYLIMHLKRITWFESENSMTATNVGIVFGPTLLWKEKDSYIDALPQTHVVELLIRFAYDVFDVTYENEVVEFQKNTGQSIPVPDPPRSSLQPITVDPNQSYTESASEGELSLGSSSANGGDITSGGHRVKTKNADNHNNPTTIPSHPRASQRSPASSENSTTSTNQGGDRLRHKSATPDLLKGRPQNERRPLSSPTSSQDEQSRTINDNSTSDEDLGSMVVQQNGTTQQSSTTNSRTTPTKNVNPTASDSSIPNNKPLTSGKSNSNKTIPHQLKTRLKDSMDNGRKSATADADGAGRKGSSKEIVEESASARRRRFERARPVRRNSRSRNYTTSIFVSPSKFEVDRRRRSSEDIPSMIAGEESASARNGNGGIGGGLSNRKSSVAEPLVYSTVGPGPVRTGNHQKTRAPLTINQSGTYIGGRRSTEPSAAAASGTGMKTTNSSMKTTSNRSAVGNHPRQYSSSLPGGGKTKSMTFLDSSDSSSESHHVQQQPFVQHHHPQNNKKNPSVGTIQPASDEKNKNVGGGSIEGGGGGSMAGIVSDDSGACVTISADDSSPPLLTRQITADGDSVHILLSAKDEELSYV